MISQQNWQALPVLFRARQYSVGSRGCVCDDLMQISKAKKFPALLRLKCRNHIFILFIEMRHPFKKKPFVIQTPTQEACSSCTLKPTKVTLFILRTLCACYTFLVRVGNVLPRIIGKNHWFSE